MSLKDRHLKRMASGDKKFNAYQKLPKDLQQKMNYFRQRHQKKKDSRYA